MSGELDLHTAQTLLPHLEHAAQCDGPVILDCGAVTFMDSTALGYIHRAYQRVQARQGCFVLVATHPAVLKVLRLTGLAEAVPLVADLEAAKAYVRNTAQRPQP